MRRPLWPASFRSRTASSTPRIESAEPDEALAKLRFILAADDDHGEFLHRFRDDPLIGNAVKTLRGMRPIRTATVVHSLLKAVCGQLIESKAARLLEARLVRLASPEHEGLRLPPQRDTFQRFTRADLARHGLVSRKGSALLRLTKELDLERLHGVSTDVAARRIERERGLGPWSAGMVCLYGLGRYECGLVGDLGLVKLVSAERGRWVETEETRELLEPYGEWAGLASLYILSSLKDHSVGRSVGKRMTSRMVSRPVSSMESLSMPSPRPAVGGIP